MKVVKTPEYLWTHFGNDEVGSSILPCGTSFLNKIIHIKKSFDMCREAYLFVVSPPICCHACAYLVARVLPEGLFSSILKVRAA
jgi:hypothetical protein